ncbi:MAG: cupredoxin domain-containing protein [Nanoarchaeota archaeon]
MTKNSMFYIVGIILVVFVGGFFLLNNEKPPITGNVIGPTVQGDVQNIVLGMKNFNYFPNTIKVAAGKPVRLSLDKSVYGCLRDFTIRDLGVRKYMKTEQDSVEFTVPNPGKYAFSCSMGMAAGTLIAE